MFKLLIAFLVVLVAINVVAQTDTAPEPASVAETDTGPEPASVAEIETGPEPASVVQTDTALVAEIDTGPAPTGLGQEVSAKGLSTFAEGPSPYGAGPPPYGAEAYSPPSKGKGSPSYGEEGSPSYGAEAYSPPPKGKGSPSYGEEGSPSYGEEGSPSYGEEAYSPPSKGEGSPSYGAEAYSPPSKGEGSPSYGPKGYSSSYKGEAEGYYLPSVENKPEVCFLKVNEFIKTKYEEYGSKMKGRYFQYPFLRPLYDQAPVCSNVNAKLDCSSKSAIRYRQPDGSCNNLIYKWWGSRLSPYQRLLEPNYSVKDGPRINTVLRESLPAARLVANRLPVQVRNTGLNGWFTFFGQIVAHDLAHTAVSPYNTCKCDDYNPECFNIFIKEQYEKQIYQCFEYKGPGKCKIDPYKQACIPFPRSADVKYVMDCKFKRREQFTKGTHFLDLDLTYGPTREIEKNIRAFHNGQLKVDKYGDVTSMPVLDINECIHKVFNSKHDYDYNSTSYSKHDEHKSGESYSDHSKHKGVAYKSGEAYSGESYSGESYSDHSKHHKVPYKSESCIYGADSRVNEHTFLSIGHLLMHRVHNKIAQGLQAVNTNWNDEYVFQEARRITGAIYQSIVYSEYLEIAIGKETMDQFMLHPLGKGYTYNYDEYLYPNNYNEFISAGFRLHQTVHTDIKFLNSKFDEVKITIAGHEYEKQLMHELNFNSWLYWDQINELMFTFVGESTYTTQFGLISPLNHLRPLTPDNKDKRRNSLGAANVQRGRDHGIHGYGDYRHMAGAPFPKDWHDLKYVFLPETIIILKSLYSSPSEIDLWVGIIAEIPDQGQLLAKTQRWLVGKNFYNLKFGDRHYFENGHDKSTRFTSDQLDNIRAFRFSSLMCMGFGEYTHDSKMPEHGFYMPSKLLSNFKVAPGCYNPKPVNKIVKCSQLPTINFKLWDSTLKPANY